MRAPALQAKNKILPMTGVAVTAINRALALVQV